MFDDSGRLTTLACLCKQFISRYCWHGRLTQSGTCSVFVCFCGVTFGILVGTGVDHFDNTSTHVFSYTYTWNLYCWYALWTTSCFVYNFFVSLWTCWTYWCSNSDLCACVSWVTWIGNLKTSVVDTRVHFVVPGFVNGIIASIIVTSRTQYWAWWYNSWRAWCRNNATGWWCNWRGTT